MKTLCLILLVSLLVVPVFGTIGVVRLSTHDVRPGDTLYAIEGGLTGDPNGWARLLKLNPFLELPNRHWVDEKGRTIVLIRPGENLVTKEEDVSAEYFYPPQSPAKPDVPTEAAIVPEIDWSWLLWLWLLVPAVLLAWFLLRMRRDPVMAGIAVVSGGVSDEEAAGRIRANTARALGVQPTDLEIRNLERGRIYGAMRVRYADNSFRTLRLNGEVGYRALVRRGQGPWTTDYMLQGCGNDLRFSRMQYVPGHGFRFVPEAAVEVAQRPTSVQPELTPEPVATPMPGPESAPVAEPVVPATLESAPTPVEIADEAHFAFKPAGRGRPNLVEFQGFTSFEVEMRDGKTTVRFS